MPPVTPPTLTSDIRQLIETSCSQLASDVNSALTLLHWQIGQRIRSEVLQGQRAEYGEQIILTLASRLEADYGRGFSSKNLRHMLRFAQIFPEAEIVYAASRQLSWTHLRSLIYIDDPLKRVAEYLTVLPPKKVLQQKLHEAIARSRQRLDNRGETA